MAQGLDTHRIDRRDQSTFVHPAHNFRRKAIWLFVLVFASYAYFFNGISNSNSTTRLALALAITENGSLTIDKFAPWTVDKAFFQGHYYADKAPGVSLMAVAILLPALRFLDTVKSPPHWLSNRSSGGPTHQFFFFEYLSMLFTSAFPVACTVIALYFAALRIGASPGGALFAALSFGLGTPAWGWATAFLGHATSAAIQFLALAGIVYLTDRTGDRPSWKKSLFAAFLVGVSLGWCIVVEYIAAPSVAFAALYGLAKLFEKFHRREATILLATAVAGALIALTPLPVYNFLAFGSPFNLGYSHVVGFSRMAEGFHGVGAPKLDVVFEILLGQYRGLLWIAPILAFSPWALWFLFKVPGQSGLAVVIAAIAVYYILLNAGYYYWDGGWSTGPRHITPILPLLCLTLSVLWTSSGVALRMALGAVLLLSIGLSLMCAAVGMDAHGSASLLMDYLYPHFTRFEWQGVLVSRLHLLPSKSRLLPLFAFWMVMALLWWRWSIRSGSVETREV